MCSFLITGLHGVDLLSTDPIIFVPLSELGVDTTELTGTACSQRTGLVWLDWFVKGLKGLSQKEANLL